MSAPGRIILKPRKARPFFARHPWLFDSSIDRIVGEPKVGDEVKVEASDGQPIAAGLYNPESAIRVRLYRWDGGALDEPFWSSQIASAQRLRHNVLKLGGPDALAYRLIFSEGDGLSGLTVDRYDRWLVVQITSLALYERRELLLRLLKEATGAEGMVVRTERGIAAKEGLKLGEESVSGSVPESAIEIVENGLKFRADLHAGQKTGFYCDQRQNRKAAASYCNGQRVLDLFCFTGGFSLNAIEHGGAVSTLGVDSSWTAIERAREHARLNGIGPDKAVFESGDVLKVLDRLRSEEKKFGVIICDPPKYAKQTKDVENALKGYMRLNQAAVDVLAPDGILVTCSCSGLVGRDLFSDVIGQVAEQSGRKIQILEQRGQAPDHPVSASCLETEYLKCLVCRVE